MNSISSPLSYTNQYMPAYGISSFLTTTLIKLALNMHEKCNQTIEQTEVLKC